MLHSFRTIVWTASLLVLCGRSARADATGLVARCDGQDDLARVLRALAQVPPGPIVVHVRGTCRGPIEIARDALTLRGDEPENAAIEGAPGPPGSASSIVSVRGARGVRLENLRISDGAVGVRVVDSEVTLDGCDVARTDVAADAESSTMALVQTTLRDARIGLAARRSRLAVTLGAMGGISDEGLLLTHGSECMLLRSEVRSDSLSISSHSTLVAAHSVLDGAIHADGYSRISLSGASGSTATLRGDLVAANSEVFLFRLPIDGAVRVRSSGMLTVFESDLGEVRLDRGSHASIASAQIAREIVAEGFSTVHLVSTVVGGLVCRSGADAVCEASRPASTSGCRSCPG